MLSGAEQGRGFLALIATVLQQYRFHKNENQLYLIVLCHINTATVDPAKKKNDLHGNLLKATALSMQIVLRLQFMVAA